jgi:undecaprenyl diphosphate synthase
MDESVALTAANRALTLTIAFNYGARAELVDAVRALVMEGAEPSGIDEAAIAKRFYDPEMPDVDLWIRTSGEYRLSNFLIWQSAYAELVFVDTYWPAFRREHLGAAVAEYQHRDRRFGGLTGNPDGAR